MDRNDFRQTLTRSPKPLPWVGIIGGLALVVPQIFFPMTALGVTLGLLCGGVMIGLSVTTLVLKTWRRKD